MVENTSNTIALTVISRLRNVLRIATRFFLNKCYTLVHPQHREGLYLVTESIFSDDIKNKK